VDDSIYYHAADIDSYLRGVRARVDAARCDLQAGDRVWIAEGNSAFTLTPDAQAPATRAVLMAHGLTDTPFSLRDIAQYFQQRGFYVLTMQLPGHGTRPGDLLDIRWQDWARSHQHLLELLQARCQQVYLLGYSAGATLSLYQALRNPSILGLFLFSPAMSISPLARLAGPLDRLGRYWPRLRWFDVQPDTDCFKYESLPNRAVAEAYRLTRVLRQLEELSERRTPLFVAASEQDATLDSRATLDWFSQQIAPRRLLYYTTGQPQVPEFVRCIPSCLPELGIRSFSHNALIQSPHNLHYGANGRQRSCLHYYNTDSIKYTRCRAGEEDCLGEMFDAAADCQVLRRLSYNPLYQNLLEELDGFIERCCPVPLE
jgi:esterase/lipase